ncbi:GGDEF domain-containing protein [Pseudoduganella sp. LjRoot289]|uniref:GGDEF domain-containing protein n=1 Tax=Pseudoduganella sp. LjRoot289 TaxID=3342314 RepID=UPI003ECCE41C
MANNAAVPDHKTNRSRGGRAYWEMQRRCVLIAGSVNVLMLIVFSYVGLRTLALLSLASMAAYALAYVCLKQRRNLLATSLMWSEVILHAGFGFLLAGPDSASQYYFLLFFPATFLSAPPRKAMLPASCILAIYLGLDAYVYAAGTIERVSAANLAIMRYFNIAVFVGMLSYLAAYYRNRVVQSEKQLRIWATSDPLTGLANRRSMDATIVELERARSFDVAVIMADIDHFKSINDRYGHNGGDIVLRRVAQAIAGCTRDSDYVARWGGEEFLIILPVGPASRVAEMAERIRRHIESMRFDELGGDGAPLTVTVTLGVAQRHANEALQATIRKADERLYDGKRLGRNRVC